MLAALDPVSHVLSTIEMFEDVQKAASQQDVAQNVRLIRATHQAAAAGDGKGEHVNVVV